MEAILYTPRLKEGDKDPGVIVWISAHFNRQLITNVIYGLSRKYGIWHVQNPVIAQRHIETLGGVNPAAASLIVIDMESFHDIKELTCIANLNHHGIPVVTLEARDHHLVPVQIVERMEIIEQVAASLLNKAA